MAGQGGPVVATARRRRSPWTSRAVGLLGVVVAIATIGACGGDDAEDEAASTTTTTTTLVGAAEAKVGDLADVVVVDAPAPYVRVPASAAPQGPFDLESYLETFSTVEDEDRASLTACGFGRGFSRLWFDRATGRVLAVFVYECSSPSAATTLRDAMEDQDRRLRTGRAFDVPAVSGARGGTYLENFDDGQGRVDVISFVRGPRLYLAAVQSESLAGHSDLALELARLQAGVAR